MSEGIKDQIAKYLTILALVVIVIGGLLSMYPRYRRSEKLKTENAALQEQIKLRMAEIARLEENQRRFRSDPDFIESIARQNRRVFPGELVFILDKE